MTQQIGHLSFAASGSGGLSGAFAEVAGTLGKFITPATVSIGVLGAIGVGAYALTSAITKSELAIGDLSDRTLTAVSGLHDLQSAAAFKGVSFDDFTKGMAHFGEE